MSGLLSMAYPKRISYEEKHLDDFVNFDEYYIK